MKDSWDTFLSALTEESEHLMRVNACALALTQALVTNNAPQITVAERALEAARTAFSSASAKRRGMQVRGFGALTLHQVSGYAPRRQANVINQRVSELMTQSISLGITQNNNKALITAGLERLIGVTGVIQRAANDDGGTYKRRGFVPAPSNSVIMSSRA